MDQNLKYQVVTLMVPYREGVTPPPEEWDWWDLADTVEPVWVSNVEDMPYADAHETLVVNGFGDEGDYADQLKEDEDVHSQG
jgi:hypothetical protein